MRRIGIGSDSLVSNTAVSLAGIELSQRRPCGVAHVTVPVLTGPAHADRTAILGHVGNNDDLRTAWHAPSFDEDVELDFAKTAGKSNLLRGRDVLIAEEDDAVIIVGALDSGEHLVVDGSGQVDKSISASVPCRSTCRERGSWQRNPGCRESRGAHRGDGRDFRTAH